MKLGNVLVVSAALAALGLVGCSAEEVDDEPEFRIADMQLEMCVRDTNKNYATPLTFEEVKVIANLECQDYGITSLEGIQWFHGLRTLYLWENQITDLSPLAAIPVLEYVELGNNQITDVSPLAVMPNLARLGLALNDIGDIAPLATMGSLRWLELDHNGLTDAAVPHLCALTNLTWLSVEHNNIANVGALSCLPSADVYAEYQNENDRSATTDSDGVPSWLLAPPRASGVAPEGRLTHEVDADGRVRFRYVTAEASYPVIREFAGEVLLRDSTLVYRSRAGEIEIGSVDQSGAQLCAGPYADVCRVALGKKGPWDGSRPVHRLADPTPVFSMALDVYALDHSRLREAGRYGARNEELIPYALASPNQQDAGSCLFMANTGAMELLMNQHVDLSEIEYEGDTDLSERFLMNASDDVSSRDIQYILTDLLYAYNVLGGSMLDRDYPFVAGYVRDTNNGIVRASAGEEGAYFSCSYNWFDDRPANWQSMLVPTPTAERSTVFVDPLRDSSSQWRVALMTTDQVDLIKHQLLTKRAPVVIVYNHYLYWHTDVIVGYDDDADSGGCPMVESSIDYYREQGQDSYASKIESHMARNGGCTDKGIFYVRDSIYDGSVEEPNYSYGNTFTDRYSQRIITRTYNWIRYLSNHAYVVYRQ